MLDEWLFSEAYVFDFFQAVRLLERLAPKRIPVGRVGPPGAEVVRFRALPSMSFPSSRGIYDLVGPEALDMPPIMTVSFLGLTGPSGVLPRHYTELILRLEREGKGKEKYAYRDWLDLFNHRFVSLFFRAWEKYRFYIPFERGECFAKDPDTFTRCLYSFIGLGMPSLRNRLQVGVREEADGLEQQKPLVFIRDLALLHYSGLLAHRPRNAVGLQALLQDYFELPVEVRQFHGQWLILEPSSQSRMSAEPANNQLGVNLVAGERVWDVQSKFRLRLGPMAYAQFRDFLPDRAPVPQSKAFFLLVQLVRLYVGPEKDFDVQLVLQAPDVPGCRLAEGDNGGARLGWTSWLQSQAASSDADDAVFEAEEIYLVG
jgi:type VI secretion system protein ImpH